MRRHLAVFPDVDLRVDDQHGFLRVLLPATLGRAALDENRASFETTAARLPQDDERS
jgi:hypothetical protein